MFGSFNFLHKLLLTDTKVSKICKIFANCLSANVKFSKTELSKMIQSGRFTHFTSNRDPIIKITNGVLSLVDSYVKEWAKRGFKKDVVIDAVLSSLGKKIKKWI